MFAQQILEQLVTTEIHRPNKEFSVIEGLQHIKSTANHKLIKHMYLWVEWPE